MLQSILNAAHKEVGGPRQEPIAILSVCSYEWRLKKKSWSFVAALRSTRSSLLRLRWCVSLNPLSVKSLSAIGCMISSKGTSVVNRQFVDLIHELKGVAYRMLV